MLSMFLEMPSFFLHNNHLRQLYSQDVFRREYQFSKSKPLLEPHVTLSELHIGLSTFELLGETKEQSKLTEGTVQSSFHLTELQILEHANNVSIICLKSYNNIIPINSIKLWNMIHHPYTCIDTHTHTHTHTFIYSTPHTLPLPPPYNTTYTQTHTIL